MLQFKTPIDLTEDADVCIGFCIDAYTENFGSADLFWDLGGAQGKGWGDELKLKSRQQPDLRFVPQELKNQTLFFFLIAQSF